MSTILVVETPELAADLERQAASLGGTLLRAVLPTGARPEATVPSLETIAREHGCALVLVPATIAGREIAARLAQRLDVALVPEATSLELTANGGHAERVVYAGGAVAALAWEGPAVVSVVARAGADAPTPDPTVDTVEVTAPDTRVVRTGLEERPKSDVDLTNAQRVVCVGMGLKDRSDLDLVDRLAEALDAQVACTRPVSEDRGWLPVERYIGISGLHVSPALYLGLGVSGQVQHAVGMRGAKVVVEVNTDGDSPAIADADHQVLADLYDVVPALIERLSAGAK
ncbi:MAG: electron transfer flavoprotein subunit alpha/FixB family protein [Pauljensenia sp.]